MRKILLSLFVVAITMTASAQIQVATFDTISLTTAQADTYLISYDYPGEDIGFNVGWAHFPCVYDTIFGGIWDHGFAYSNMTDSATSGAANQYSSKTGAGYNGSSTYAVAWCSQYGTAPARITFPTYVPDTVKGFYITNSTYAYNSMRDGDAFGKKFGGVTGNDPDWFLLTIKGYNGGNLTADSVNFYLADFRDANNANDYMVNTWEWVDLVSLGKVDSLAFKMNSSDTSFGLVNTPTYFCIDDFTTLINPIHVKPVAASAIAAKVYPNPATDNLFIELADNTVNTINVFDVAGRLVMSPTVNDRNIKINTATLQPGVYFLQLKGDKQTASARFIKQ